MYPQRDKRGEDQKQLLADALRRYPTWGHAWLAARDLLLDIEGSVRHWLRKRRLRKAGITVAWTDPNNPKKDWKSPKKGQKP